MATNQEISIHGVKQIIRTPFRGQLGVNWIELHVVCNDGSEIDIKLYPALTDREGLARLNQQFNLEVVK